MIMPAPITNEPKRVIIRDELAKDVILGYLEYNDSPYVDEFRKQFDVVGYKYLGNQREDFFRGVTFITVIKRKSDDRLFGYEHWEPVDKYAETMLESNGDDHGIETEYDDEWKPIGGEAYVFLPVKPFTITGYEVQAVEQEL